MTGQQLLSKLQQMTPEELEKPIEVAVRTHTKEYPDYCMAYDFYRNSARIMCTFEEGVTISRRKKP